MQHSQPSEHGVGRRDLLGPGRDREELTAYKPLKRGLETVPQARRMVPNSLEVHIKRQPQMNIIVGLYAQLIDAVVSPDNIGAQGEMWIESVFHAGNQVGRGRGRVKRDVSNIIAFDARIEQAMQLRHDTPWAT